MIITFKNTCVPKPLTLYQKSCRKPIKRDLKRYTFLHNANHHVIRNDDIYTLKERSFNMWGDGYEIYSLSERNYNKNINILSKYPK